MFELLGILGTFKMAELSYAGSHIQNRGRFRLFINIVQTSRPSGKLFLALFKLPDPGANIYVQSLLKFPTWGAHERSKSPPHPVVPPSGITLIAALKCI